MATNYISVCGLYSDAIMDLNVLNQPLRPSNPMEFVELIDREVPNNDLKWFIHVSDDGTSDGERTYQVSKHFISHQSPLWDAAVARNAHRVENVHLHTYEVQVMFTNDDHRAICLVLCIMHQNLHCLPVLLTLEELRNLAETTAKYDLIPLVDRFLDHWLSIYHGPIYEPEPEDWLAVAYHFGNDVMYMELAKYLAFQSQVDEGGALLVPGTGRPLQTISIPHAYSCISTAREQALSQLLDVVRDVIAEPCCVPHVDNPAWNNHALEDYLEKYGLFPKGDLRRTRISIYQVLHLLIADKTAHHTSSLDLKNHLAGCNVLTRLRDQALKVDMHLSWAADVRILTQIGINAAKRGRFLHPKSRGVRLMPRDWRNERELHPDRS